MKKNKLKLLKKIVNGDTNLSFKEESMKTLILTNFTNTQIKLLIYLFKEPKNKRNNKEDNAIYNQHDKYIDKLDKREIDYFSRNINGRSNKGLLEESVIDSENTYDKA